MGWLNEGGDGFPLTGISRLAISAKMSLGICIVNARAVRTSDFSKISISGPVERGFAPSNPLGSNIIVPKVCMCGGRSYIRTEIFAATSAWRTCSANQEVSPSVSYAILTAENLPRRAWIKSHCSWLNERGCNRNSSLARLRSASDARAFASSAALLASATDFLASAWSASPATRATLSNQSSNPTPPAIKRSAIAWTAISQTGRPDQNIPINSTARPRTISHATFSARRVNRSCVVWGDFSVFGFPVATYIRPRFKPSKGLSSLRRPFSSFTRSLQSTGYQRP